MRLDLATWPEVESYLDRANGIILPTGSTEQHGPMGLIGTDALCAEIISEGAARKANAYVAPVLAYTPAPFNTGFPGTVSISTDVFTALAREIYQGLSGQGFTRIYVINGHGANIVPLRDATRGVEGCDVRIRSWWDFAQVNVLRQELYGDWEGMHATPSEVSITQAVHRTVAPGPAAQPPEMLSPSFIKAHAGDRHGPPEAHRARFPDGRVGSHSALARPAHGEALIDAAVDAVHADYESFIANADDRPES